MSIAERIGTQFRIQAPPGTGGGGEEQVRVVDDRAGSQLPAWPITWLFIGLPVWWLVGLYPLSPVIMSIPMVYFLLTRQPKIIWLPGILPYVAFTGWLITCVIVLGDYGDVLGFGMRFCLFASYAVVLLYVVNARKALTSTWLLRCVGFTYAWIVLGGYIGMFFPEGSLKYTVGMLLPGSLASNEYIFQLFTPPFAEIQEPWGVDEPFYRPSAPFLYANGWGAAVGILIPAVIGVAAAQRNLRTKVLLVLALAAAVPPMVQSTNRGLLLGVVVAVVYVAIRFFLRGQLLLFLGIVLTGAVASATLVSVGVLEGIVERQNAVDTTEGRGNLYLETWQRTLESPLFGFGAPQPSYTSEIFVGTQGMLWSLMFCYGLVGCGFFFYFLSGILIRTWAAPNASALWLQASIVTATFVGIFYGLDRHLPIIMLLAGFLLRERYAEQSSFWKPVPRRWYLVKAGALETQKPKHLRSEQ
ncbi:hypothetical protein ACT3UA_15555 [Glutamicibacter sp. 363]|uniref:hypothetical protein n=1 Tax=Glutamicibacter sp. 363 TaxID=3457731 RepID=UPI0040333D85